MSKLWLIEVTRELEDKFIGHMRQDIKPTEQEIIKWLSEQYINDDPEYTEYDVSEVVV